MPSKYYIRNHQPNSYYHIFNRGAHKHDIFHSKVDYQNFQTIMSYYLQYPSGMPLSYINRILSPTHNPRNFDPKPTYQLICFCLMPNHFHLLLHQRQSPTPDNSISSFMRRLGVTYSMYFNQKYSHSGTLFQGRYKNVAIQYEEQLLQVTKYIHLNPGPGAHEHYPYSSYPHFIKPQTSPTWLNPQPILRYFSSNYQSLSYSTFTNQNTTPSAFTSQLLIDL